MFPESNSQAMQDIFVLAVLAKAHGTFIEIGGFHSRNLSNTFLLEKAFHWDGLIVEIDERLADEISENRESEVLNEDAVKINWGSILRRRPELRTADYLQVDCEPAVTSLAALMRVIRAGVRPTVITFEHDAYAGHTFMKIFHQGRLVRGASRLMLRWLGYNLLAGDIMTQTGKPFEDWYVLSRRIGIEISPFHIGPWAPGDFLQSTGLVDSYRDFRKRYSP